MQRFPVTLVCVVVIVVLHQAVQSYNRAHTNGLGGLHEFGAVSQLVVTSRPELHGPFMLWDGEWWRILGSGFHHVDWVHLICNAIGLVYLGWLLEERIGSRRMLLFLLVSTYVSLLPCFLLEHSVVGLSGGIYAMFGLLFIMRFHDEDLQRLMPAFFVVFGFAYLPIGMILTETDLYRLSNLGHASGLVYGIFTGLAFYPPTERTRFKPRWFFAGHLLLIPATWLVTHPFWNARYHWRMAVRAEGDEQIAALRTAVEWDPALSGAWRHLAQEERRLGNHAAAWRARFEALKANPTDRKSLDAIYRAWQFASRDEEQIAWQVLDETFPESAGEWRRNLGLYGKPFVPRYQRYRNPFAASKPPVPSIANDLFWPPMDRRLFTVRDREQRAPRVDPNDPGSALLGTSL